MSMKGVTGLCFLLTFTCVYGGWIQYRNITLKDGTKIMGNGTRTVDENRLYNTYEGIPYALPPLGPLRFKDPMPLNESYKNIVINATKPGNMCIQTDINNSSFPTIGEEDCLVINVYVPHLISKEKLPVMVFIHGGSFENGDGSSKTYGPDYLINEYLIVVTMNYRLGFFGFLSSGDSSATGNYGLKDQIMALKWVQENIETFGGDKSKVTLFGQSAGAASVSYLTQTNLTKGLFSKAILQSGGSLCVWALSKNHRDMIYTTSILLKLKTSSTEIMVEELRSVDAKKLQQTIFLARIKSTLTMDYFNGLPFGPTYEPEGPNAVVIYPSHQHLIEGGFHNIPYIIGFTSQESVTMAEGLLPNAIVRYNLWANHLVPNSLNVTNPLEREWIAGQIRYHYNLVPELNLSTNVYQFLSDNQFNRPIMELIKLLSASNDVYAYNFSYIGDLGTPPKRSSLGVGHADDLQYFWYKTNAIVNPSDADLRTRSRLIKLWSNFARYSEPTPEKTDLFQNVLWTKTKAKEEIDINFLNIGNELKMEPTSNIKNIEFWQKIFWKYGHPPFGTY